MEIKDKVGNTFLPPAVRTLLFLHHFGEKDGSGGGKLRKEKRQYFLTACNKDASFPQYFLTKRLIGSRENKERKGKVSNTFLPPAIRTLLFHFWGKRWIRWRENKERKDKVGNTFLPSAIRTLLVLTLFGEKDGLG